MRITVDKSVLDLAASSEGAFLRAKDAEMLGALEQGWFDLLRWARGFPVDTDALRLEAARRAAAGEIPPWPSRDD